MAGGRPSDYDKKYCNMLIKYMAQGYSYEAFAGLIDVCKQTLYNWEKEHPEFLDAKRRARSKCQAKLEQLGHDLVTGKSKGNASVWIFMMKNMTGWRDDPVLDEDDAIEDLNFIDDEESPY